MAGDTKCVGIWIRVSTDDQVRGESPEVHEKRARMYAEARDWKVRQVYRLDAGRGEDAMQHPEGQRVRAGHRSGRLPGLHFTKNAPPAPDTAGGVQFWGRFPGA